MKGRQDTDSKQGFALNSKGQPLNQHQKAIITLLAELAVDEYFSKLGNVDSASKKEGEQRVSRGNLRSS